MKKMILPIFAAVVLFAAGCSFFPAIEGSGFPKTMSFDSAGFTQLTVEHPFKVKVVPDTVYSVSVTCDDNIVPYLIVDRVGNTLTVSLIRGYDYRQVILAAEVHMPALSALSLSAAAEARVDAGFAGSLPVGLNLSGASIADFSALTCGALTAAVSGASSLTIASLSATTVSMNLSGASVASAGGSAGSETLVVSGLSGANLQSLLAGQAGVQLSGASRASVNVGSGQITLNASGASTLFYAGSPTFVINDLSGGSNVQRL
jgi:hypothetical protein